jgi:flagellar biosynthesis/type III secretory pathway M-ring protein FliF/YscJ|tara:strand:- start:2297 stop:2410 length:114 start_codon:yes stop_codon:yes gene_type:complete
MKKYFNMMGNPWSKLTNKGKIVALAVIVAIVIGVIIL